MEGKVVAYFRVSTQRQGESGLGLEAQREAVLRFLNGGDWKLAKEFTEVESGGKAERPELDAAMRYAKRYGATVIVAKLDRLARDVQFLLGVLDAGVPLRFVDLPDVTAQGAAGRMILTVMGSVAEFEARRLSERTKAALAAKKTRGEKLGNPESLAGFHEARSAKAKQFARTLKPLLAPMIKQGESVASMVRVLNESRVPTAAGIVGGWSPTQLKRVLGRLAAERR